MILTGSVMQTIAVIVSCVGLCVCMEHVCCLPHLDPADHCLYTCLGPNCCVFSPAYQLLAIKLTWPDSTPHTGS